MSTPRRPLAPVNTNRPRGNELSPNTRGHICGMSLAGWSISKISDQLGIARSTVQYTLEQNPTRYDNESRPRAGRPSKISARSRALILRLIKTNPFITYGDIPLQARLNVHNSTILRMLKESGYGHWRAKERPQLLERQAKIRLE